MLATWAGYLLLTVAGSAAYVGMAQIYLRYGSLRGALIPATILWYALAFITYLGLVLWSEARRRISPGWLWATAILFRLLLLLTRPSLSDDVYRYMWDGHVAQQGISPYALAVDAPALDVVEVPGRAMVNNAWMASPYLPVAQWLFYTLAALWPWQPLALQLAMIVFDLAGAVLIRYLLQLAQLPSRRVALYLWHPLVIVEVAHGAHIDAWMVFLTLLAFWWAWWRPRSPDRQWAGALAPLFSPLLLALATLTKVMPLLLFPVLFWRWSWRQRLTFSVAIAAILLPFGLRSGWGLSQPLDGTGLFGALRIYFAQWNFNSGIPHWLDKALGGAGFGAPLLATRLITAVLLAGLLLLVMVISRHQTRPRAIMRLAMLPLAATVLLSATLHPWYLMLPLAFLPFLGPSDDEPSSSWLAVVPWIYLSGTVVLSYLTYRDQLAFAEREWVRQLEWIPTLLLSLAWAACRVWPSLPRMLRALKRSGTAV